MADLQQTNGRIEGVPHQERGVILISHANPEDNDCARWLASRLVTAGYKVWVDLNSLRGGDDFWSEIEKTLREDAIKQIVLVSRHIRKPGVLKELALGDLMRRKLDDPRFMIPIRIDNISYSDFPTEILRQDCLSGFPSWAEDLPKLLKTLEDDKVPKSTTPIATSLKYLIEAQEVGRATIKSVPEELVTNWLPVRTSRASVWVYDQKGTRKQLDAWTKATRVPHAIFGERIVSLWSATEITIADDIPPPLKASACLPFSSVLAGEYRRTFPNDGELRKLIVNLLRQNWDWAMHARGLKPVQFANGATGWFFPDGLVEGKATKITPSGRRASRVLSGKFKERRWHLCLVGQPKLWPEPVLRVHANVVVTEDGQKPLPGEKLQRLRLRLTRSWWNDKWRDMLIASLGWLAEGNETLLLSPAEEGIAVDTMPATLEISVSFDVEETRASEEGVDGSINLSADYEAFYDDLDESGEAEVEGA
jgi:hypothetical protein